MKRMPERTHDGREGGWSVHGINLVPWAYDARAPWPHTRATNEPSLARELGKKYMLVEDHVWDFNVSAFASPRLLVAIAGDPNCPKRRFFLSCLYIMSADAVTIGGSYYRERLEEALERAEGSSDPWLTTWAKRTRRLLDAPRTLNRHEWMQGSWAGDSLAAKPVE